MGLIEKKESVNAEDIKKDLLDVIDYLADYEESGLTSEQVMDLSEAVKKLERYFGDNITVNQVIDFFVDFYVAQGDSNRIADAVLLTNEDASRYRELKKRDTAKAPLIHKNKFSDTYVCPNCNLVFINKDEKGWFCGKHYKFCPNCGQRIKWEDSGNSMDGKAGAVPLGKERR